MSLERGLADEILVARTLSGKLSAFAELVQRHKDAIFAIAFSRVKDFDEAEDIAQDAFVAAYVNLSTLKDRSKFARWISTITVNLCNAKIAGKPAVRVDLEDMEKQDAFSGVVSSPLIRVPKRPDEIYEQKELRELVQKAIGKLGDKSREAIVLFYINGYSYEEMSAYLSVPVNTIKARLNLGRKRLREEIMRMMETTLKQEAPEEAFTERVLTELCLGFPEGFISIAGSEDDENSTIILSTKSRDPEKARLIALTIRKEDAQAIFGFHGADTEEVRWKRETYELVKEILDVFGIKLDKIVLKLEGERCYAEVFLHKGRTIKEIQTRASDGLSLAYRMKAPVWATPELIRRGKVSEGDLPPAFEESLEAMKTELLDSTSEEELIELAFEHGLNPEARITRATWTDTGQMIIEGKKPIPFDSQVNQRVLARMREKVGHYGGHWITDDNRRYTMTYEALEHGVTIEFSPDSEQPH